MRSSRRPQIEAIALLRDTWKILPLILVVAVGSPGTASLIPNSTFEADTPDTTPRAAPLDPDPAGWSIQGTQLVDSNGVRDISVEAVGSPFGGGNQSMLLFNDNQTTGGSRHQLSASLTSQTMDNVLMEFDIRFNAPPEGPNRDHHFRLFASGVPATGYTFRAWAGDVEMRADSSLQRLDYGTWYHLETYSPSTRFDLSDYTISVTDFPTMTTNVYTAGNRGSVLGRAYSNFLFNTNNSITEMDFNLDNFRISVVPEPSTGLLLFAGLPALGFLARRRRSAGRRSKV